MMYFPYSLFAWMSVAGCLFGLSLYAATDLRPGGLASNGSTSRFESEEDRFNGLFAKAMTALKARSFEESRLLFIAASDSADISKMPMSWLTAQFNACHALCLQGRKPEAELLARQIAVRCESALGMEDPLSSEALAYLAFVLKQNGHLEGAEPVYRRHVQVLEAKYGGEHYLVATAICKHASLLQSMGKISEAETLQRKAFAIMQKVASEEHPDICYFLTNLAYCLQAAQKTDEASELMQKAFDIVQSRNDQQLTSAGSILRKQAEFYRDQQQYDRAEALARRALLRLAKRPEINRARFYYYDLVADVYRSILQARGLDGAAIAENFRQLDAEVVAAKTTSTVAR